MTAQGDTIAAIATAPGPSGVAVVRVSGPDAFSIARRIAGRVPAPGSFAFTSFRDPRRTGESNPVVDRGLVLSFAAPRSYTGEDVVEFHGHGGTLAPKRVLEACLAAGARLARRGEFTQRAFLRGKIGFDEAESLLDFINAKTDRAADMAMSGMGGEKKRTLRSIYDMIVDLASSVENSLDVDESDLDDAFFAGLDSALAKLKSAIDAAIRREREGRLLREGALVVIAGAPNAGKSSLMNALLREDRAIVSSVPGTTRDSIEEWLDVDGWPVRLVDTAGLRETDDAIEAEGVRRAKKLAEKADLVIALDCDVPGALRIHAKCDLGRSKGLNVSSLTGEGLAELRQAIADALSRRWAKSDEPFGKGESCGEASSVLVGASALLPSDFSDLVLAGNALRRASERIGAEIGAEYTDDLLDRLFSRFCVGK